MTVFFFKRITSLGDFHTKTVFILLKYVAIKVVSLMNCLCQYYPLELYVRVVNRVFYLLERYRL